MISVLNYGLYSEFGDFYPSFSVGTGGGASATAEHTQLNWVGLSLFQLMMWLVQVISLNMYVPVSRALDFWVPPRRLSPRVFSPWSPFA